MATERSLERCGVDAFDLLLLHNPDRTGFSSEAVWDGLERCAQIGLTRLLGVAPGPANGFTLDLIGCFERFGGSIDWAMIILNPMEPWPGELVLPAARAHDVKPDRARGRLRRPVLGRRRAGARLPGPRPPHVPSRGLGRGGARAARAHEADGADRHGLTPLQLACQWDLAQEPVACVAPTLIQEAGAGARPVEDKRAELAALPAERLLSGEELDEIRSIGDNTGCMALKGGSPDHEGAARADRWELTPSSATWPRAGRSSPSATSCRRRRRVSGDVAGERRQGARFRRGLQPARLRRRGGALRSRHGLGAAGPPAVGLLPWAGGGQALLAGAGRDLRGAAARSAGGRGRRRPRGDPAAVPHEGEGQRGGDRGRAVPPGHDLPGRPDRADRVLHRLAAALEAATDAPSGVLREACDERSSQPPWPSP